MASGFYSILPRPTVKWRRSKRANTETIANVFIKWVKVVNGKQLFLHVRFFFLSVFLLFSCSALFIALLKWTGWTTSCVINLKWSLSFVHFDKLYTLYKITYNFQMKFVDLITDLIRVLCCWFNRLLITDTMFHLNYLCKLTHCLFYFHFSFRSLAVAGEFGFRLFTITSVERVEEIFCSNNEDTKIAERLFSSSLVAVVTAAEADKLKVIYSIMELDKIELKSNAIKANHWSKFNEANFIYM